MKSARKICASLLAALLLCLSMPAAAENAAVYKENAWNFVDVSMDVSGGIPANAEGVLARVRESGVLRVATEPYYPPQEFIDPTLSGQDQYVGADMEMARFIAQRMGVKLEIVPMEFIEVLEAVAEGECDLAISALAYTPERASLVTLSKGYHYADEPAGASLLIREEDREKIKTVADLSSRTLIAQSGSLQEALVAEYVTTYREFRRVSLMDTLFQQLRRDKADAAAVDPAAAQAYIQKNPDCRLMLVPGVHFALNDYMDGDRVAAAKGETQLIAFVNGCIDELTQANQYETWFDYFETYTGTKK